MSCHPAAAIGRPPWSMAEPRLGDLEPAWFPERCAAPVTPVLWSLRSFHRAAPRP